MVQLGPLPGLMLSLYRGYNTRASHQIIQGFTTGLCIQWEGSHAERRHHHQDGSLKIVGRKTLVLGQNMFHLKTGRIFEKCQRPTKF